MPNSGQKRGDQRRSAQKPIARKKPPLKQRAKKKQAMEQPRGVLSDKEFEKLFRVSCGSKPAQLAFNPDWTKFSQLGEVMWFCAMKRGLSLFLFSPGEFAAYLRSCYASYLKGMQAWVNNDDDILNCGEFFIPQGMALLFRACSSHTNKARGYALTVSNNDSPTDAFFAIPKWRNNRKFVAGPLDIQYADGGVDTVTVLTPDEMSEISQTLRYLFSTTTKVSEIPKTAKSGEMFLGIDGSAIQPTYKWVSGVSLVKTADVVLAGFQCAQYPRADMQIIVYDMLMNTVDFFGSINTVKDVLHNNGYDAMQFNVASIDMNPVYLAQIFDAVHGHAGLASGDFYNFCVASWAYIGAFFPVVSNVLAPWTVSDPKFKDWKMPYPLQFAARQTQLKIGSTYYYGMFLDSVGTFNWTSVYQGADTSQYTELGTPGFLSDSVPNPVQVASHVLVAGDYSPDYLRFSYNLANDAYRVLELTGATLMGMSSVIDHKMSDCSCFASYQATKVNDDRVNPDLGSYHPLAIVKLECASRLPESMCKLSAAYTWRTFSQYTPAGNKNIATTSRAVFDNTNDSALRTAVSYSVASNTTSVQVLQAAGKGIDKYVKGQAAGGYNYYRLSEAQIKKMVTQWATSSPYVSNVTNSLGKFVADVTQNYITEEQVMEAAGWAGPAALTTLTGMLVKKMIGFSGGNRRSEL